MRQNTDLPTNTGSVQFVKATNNSTLQQQGRQATPLGVWAAIGDRGADKNRRCINGLSNNIAIFRLCT